MLLFKLEQFKRGITIYDIIQFVCTVSPTLFFIVKSLSKIKKYYY